MKGKKQINIVGNCLYIIKYAYKLAPVYYSLYILSSFILNALTSSATVLIFKVMIENVQKELPYHEAISPLFIYGAIMTLNIIVMNTFRHYNKAKTTRISGVIQRDIMKKAKKIDNICYDKPEFYNDLIRAAERGEEYIFKSIQIVFDMIASISRVIGIISVILMMDFILAMLPITACILSFVIYKLVTVKEYKMQMALDPIRRKRNYSSKAFYQVEYAKELRLSEISDPLFRQFNDSIKEEIEMINKCGFEIVILKIIHTIFGGVLVVNYLPTLYLVYNTKVTNKLRISEMSTLYNANSDIYNNLNDAVWNITGLQSIGLYGESFRKFMEYEERIEGQKGQSLNTEEPHVLEIKNLSFRYDEKNNYVLKNINMTINPKEKIAIVGHNGAGKTTLVKLLLHLYNPTEGEILYDGKNINNYDIQEYRKAFSSVFQDFQIYPLNIAENIMMQDTSGEDNENIDKLLDMVQLKEKINSLKNKKQTNLTKEFDDEGTILSGGEAQKLAIARAFARKAPIAILDEASSALDPIAEYNLNNSMVELSKSSSCIFISHRLSTTCMADKIYMFGDGRVIEQGSHDELMKLNGEYAKMFNKQAFYYVS